MSLCPIVEFTEELNNISAQITGIERRVNNLLGVISILQTEADDKMSFMTDIAKYQLKVLENCLKQPPEERNFHAINLQIDKSLEEVKEIYLEDYLGLLKARGHFMEEGKRVPLTHEKIEQLKKSFHEKLDSRIVPERVQIDETTNLEFVVQSLREKCYIGEVLVNALFQEKTEKTMDLEDDLNPELNRLMSQRACLREKPQVNNIFVACQLGALDYIQNEVDQQPKNLRSRCINQKNLQGFAPIHFAAYHNHLAILKFLIQRGCDVNIQDADGYQAIHWAAKRGGRATIALLIKHQVSLNAKGTYGRTPLHMSVYNHCLATTKFLIEEGANLNAKADQDNLKTPLHEAVLHGDEEMVKCLAQFDHLDDERLKLDVNLTDALGWSPIRHAVQDGLANIFELLILHPTWSPPKDIENPNSIESLLQLANQCVEKEQNLKRQEGKPLMDRKKIQEALVKQLEKKIQIETILSQEES